MTSEADGVMPSRRLELVADQADELRSALADGARAQHEDGDLLASRQIFERAYGLAEQAGDVQAMALAALGLAGLWVCERRTVTSAVLLEARPHPAGRGGGLLPRHARGDPGRAGRGPGGG